MNRDGSSLLNDNYYVLKSMKDNLIIGIRIRSLW